MPIAAGGRESMVRVTGYRRTGGNSEALDLGVMGSGATSNGEEGDRRLAAQSTEWRVPDRLYFQQRSYE